MIFSFSETIQTWYNLHKRQLPWRDTKNPYNIWLSEIILQQTRVNQGLPYYRKFFEAFPTIQDFANAEENHILNLWQGLGYYSRGRNMLKCAKKIVSDYGGVFPISKESLTKLPGIGDYTASAIASFAFDQPNAVLDGNVYRVLSRYFGIDSPINVSSSQKLFKSLAQDQLDLKNPANYNQAIMEFGALQCTPSNPDCKSCPLAEGCVALRENKVNQLPVKIKSKPKRIRHFNYFVFVNKSKVLISQRSKKGIWQGLYQFPLIETEKSYSREEIKPLLKTTYCLDETSVNKRFTFKHLLSHQTIYADFWIVPVSDFGFNLNSDIFEVELKALGADYAMPVLIHKFLGSGVMEEICL